MKIPTGISPGSSLWIYLGNPTRVPSEIFALFLLVIPAGNPPADIHSEIPLGVLTCIFSQIPP